VKKKEGNYYIDRPNECICKECRDAVDEEDQRPQAVKDAECFVANGFI